MFKEQQDILTQIHQLEGKYRRSLYVADKRGNVVKNKDFASSDESEDIHDQVYRLLDLNTYIRRILDRPWAKPK